MIKNIILSTLTIALLAACSSKKDENLQKDAVQTIPVKVMKLERQSVSKTVDYTANLEAEEQVFYAPATPSRIEKIHVEVGDRIKQGQLLVEMDRTNLHQAEVQLKNLETEYNRAKMLNETQSISKQAYDAAVTQYEVAKSNVEFLRENTRLVAPFNGVVTGKFYENGEMYSASPVNGAAKASIISIEKINPLKAYVNVTEQYFPIMKSGTDIQLRSSIYPGKVFPGKVSIVYPTIDKNSRTFTVEIKIPNDDQTLRPGMFGAINFFIGETNTLIVPALAVLKLQGANNRYIFLNNKGKAKRVDVQMGRRFEDQVEIMSAQINEGDELVVAGQARLVDGTPISVAK